MTKSTITCNKCGEEYVGYGGSAIYDHEKICPGCKYWRPPPLAEALLSFKCCNCGEPLKRDEACFSDDKENYWHVACRSAKPPKVGGNYDGPDIDKWFGLRKPTAEDAAALGALRVVYKSLAKAILDTCPTNPDRTVAIRQLKESMHTAITSIVCADAWQT